MGLVACIRGSVGGKIFAVRGWLRERGGEEVERGGRGGEDGGEGMMGKF